ncbi:unnamed protein product [Rotaria sp. Silwood2]|nr:unnamed protein product [Rotaria sp. Silwood2]CAF4313330.1 unnamed protein product [Rotaria sp. Silwood2]
MESIIHNVRRSKFFKFTLVISISLVFVILVYRTDRSNRLSIPVFVSEFDEAVKIISGLRLKSTSLYGLKYRAMICTIVRNDPHLLEFLLRHLITGFSHIVIYDNNRILSGYDMNISNLLAPFIAADVVTHIPWYQNTTNLLPNDIKNQNSVECLNNYAKDADWVAILDTDEYFYYEKKNTAVNTLNDLLLELEKNHRCGVHVPWTMTYGEAKVLRQNKTLFEAYPRMCGIYGLNKVLARAALANFNIPHGTSCKLNNYSTASLGSNNISKTSLVHYYSKSMEEHLVKVDQSIPPYIRVPISSYRLKHICTRDKVKYAEDYENAFLRSYKRLEAMHSLQIVNLRPSPSLNIKQMTDYALYIHLKYRCAKRHEFDNDKYLSINPSVKEQVKNGSLPDGFYHFMANFLKGAVGCWRTHNDSFCE